MPTYEYACSACHHEWEAEQSIKDAALTECPTCHEQTARRQISRGGGFILKGGGWYSDLYSSTSNKASPSESKSEGKSESSSSGDSSKSSGDSSKKSEGGGSGTEPSAPAATGSSVAAA